MLDMSAMKSFSNLNFGYDHMRALKSLVDMVSLDFIQ